MSDEPRHPDSISEELPADLADDLNTLYGASFRAPRRVDEAVMAAARDRLGARELAIETTGRSFAWRIGVWGGPLAAAAAVALVAFIWPHATGPAGPTGLPGGSGGRANTPLAKQMMPQTVADEMGKDQLAFAESAREEFAALSSDSDDRALGRAAMETDAAGDSLGLKGERRDRLALAAAAAPLAREDIDENGTIDIRDALALARTLERGEWAIDARWDMNHDGVIDGGDVKMVALAAVDLGRRGGAGGGGEVIR